MSALLPWVRAMTLREKVELLLISAAAGAAAAIPGLPRRVATGELILAASVLLLGQGLIRDLWIKYRAPKPPPAPADAAEPSKPRGLFCMCMESTVGMLGVIAGCGIVLAGVRHPIDLPAYFWPVAVLVIGVIGFVIKDYVLDWKTWSIRREKDHQNVVFW